MIKEIGLSIFFTPPYFSREMKLLFLVLKNAHFAPTPPLRHKKCEINRVMPHVINGEISDGKSHFAYFYYYFSILIIMVFVAKLK